MIPLDSTKVFCGSPFFDHCSCWGVCYNNTPTLPLECACCTSPLSPWQLRVTMAMKKPVSVVAPSAYRGQLWHFDTCPMYSSSLTGITPLEPSSPGSYFVTGPWSLLRSAAGYRSRGNEGWQGEDVRRTGISFQGNYPNWRLLGYLQARLYQSQQRRVCFFQPGRNREILGFGAIQIIWCFSVSEDFSENGLFSFYLQPSPP